ncbi:MORN repeat-containing protein 3 [Camponotus floridanus]|uniref:MORN repeat-containing protein 3 n=1 Tax=Camponotus floridanus TaxID=104421 RepID=E1ZXA3_CAMFO|nr:MORN repeat-containing protein 3 [Camponotus floridanus]
MPFLKVQKVTWCEQRIESCKRNGWRHAIYSPQAKRIVKAHYKGEWRNDKKEGKGIGVSSNGWMYEGDWLKDHKHGYGILSKISKDGNIRKVYAGNWIEGKKHGFGSNWYRDESYYEGTFQENKRNGYGRIWYKCGSRYYQGTWSNDRYHGEGIFIQENGNLYEGQFINGKKEGRGVFYHFDSHQVQKGRWENDVCINSTIEDIDYHRLYPTLLHIPRINS